MPFVAHAQQACGAGRRRLERTIRDGCEAIDGGFKVVDGSEDDAHQAPAREFGEKC
jgi:hypothetical protein